MNTFLMTAKPQFGNLAKIRAAAPARQQAARTQLRAETQSFDASELARKKAEEEALCLVASTIIKNGTLNTIAISGQNGIDSVTDGDLLKAIDQLITEIDLGNQKHNYGDYKECTSVSEDSFLDEIYGQNYPKKREAKSEVNPSLTRLTRQGLLEWNDLSKLPEKEQKSYNPIKITSLGKKVASLIP